MWTQLYPNLAVLLPIFTHVIVILRGQVVRSPQKRAEKNCSGAHERSLICSNAICFFCRIIRRYLRGKNRSVALALVLS